MIEFLKKSTFAVNDVVNKSWEILYKNYQNIAGICLLMFFVLATSTFLSSFSTKSFNIINIVILLLFMVVYLGLQLTLFKYILYLIAKIDTDEETFTHKIIGFLKNNYLKLIVVIAIPMMFLFLMSIISEIFGINALWFQIATLLIGFAFVIFIMWNQIKPFALNVGRFWPTNRQLGNLLLGTLYLLILMMFTILIIAVLFFPIAYTKIIELEQLTSLAFTVGFFLALYVVIRISFFPFFIIDQDFDPFKSIRLSMAVTRGNFTMLLLLLGLIIIVQTIGAFLQAKEYYFLQLAVSIIFSFIIIPLSSVATAVAYRQMMNEYHGDSDPDIMDSII
ncbi:MAG: hypothetical protein JWN56_890 [Sphingobacteriales bacterium]|nr:hypothetical protein [Sphingobacteriales bacterium]